MAWVVRVEQIARIWALLAGAVLLAIMAATSLNTLSFLIGRFTGPFGFVPPALPGYEDFVSLAIAVAALAFMPWCQLQRGHIAIDIIVSRLPETISNMIDKAWLVLLTAVCLFLAYWLATGMIEARSDNAMSPILGWPRWPFFGPGIISLLLWANVCATQIFTPSERAQSGQ
ncbi:MAG: TRAP transporter small permease [Pseudomonadota bacterium]